MSIVRYHDGQQYRVALIVKRTRKYLHVLVIDAGALRRRRVPLAEERYMRALDAGRRQRRKCAASLRRLARGYQRALVRAALAEDA